jgi:hypothetical protein
VQDTMSSMHSNFVPDRRDPVALEPELLALCVEQAMRCTGDESVVHQIATCTTTTELLSAIGEQLGSFAYALLAGSPLLCALQMVPLEENWRDWFPPRPNSLWCELVLLRDLAGATADPSPLDELVSTRRLVEEP